MEPGGVRDLRSLLADGRRLEIEDAIRIIIGCCGALAGADRCGGISPGRILISSQGDVTIGDFALSPEILGYASPELVDSACSADPTARSEAGGYVVRPTPEGVAAAADPRAAIFALGAILWEMIAGRRLFKGETDYETMLLAGAADVPPLATAAPELEAIVRRALARRVDDRYGTADQLAEALAGYLAYRAQR